MVGDEKRPSRSQEGKIMKPKRQQSRTRVTAVFVINLHVCQGRSIVQIILFFDVVV